MRPLAILDRTRIVLFILIGYCVLHFIVRLTVSPVFSLDEAEQMLFSQDLQWGYRFRHPPLITWLTALTQEVFGLNRWSFFALKYAIMAGGFVALFFAAQEILKDTRLAASATFLWGLTYVLGWYPHADLMHTVLLTSLLAACLHAFTRILNHGGWLDYTYFGITLGLGFLAKYVFAILPVIGLVALLFVPKLAERVHWYRLSAAFFIAALIIAPYALWILANQYSLTALAGEMTKADEQGFFLVRWATGWAELALASVEFTLPLSVLFLLFFPWTVRRLQSGSGAPAAPDAPTAPNAPDISGDDLSAYRRWLEVLMIIGLLVFASLVFFGATFFKARWMHQILLVFPLYLMIRLAQSRIDWARLRWLLILTLGVSVLVVAARYIEFHAHAATCGKCRTHLPIKAWAEGLQQSGFSGGTIITGDYHLGGNLRYFVEGARIVDPAFPLTVFPAPEGAGQCVIAWALKKELREPPERLVAYAADVLKAPVPATAEVKTATAPLIRAPNRERTLAWIVYEAPQSDCR